MRGRRGATRTGVIAVALVTAVSLTACGRSGDSATRPAASASAAAPRATTTTPGAAQCPSEPTQRFAKARFATNIGLAVGTFNHWIYQPYRAGTFAAGAKGREIALVKAGAAGVFAAKQLTDARTNVLADPALCRAFLGPLTAAQTQLEELAEQLTQGRVADIPAVETTLLDVTRTAERRGIAITERVGI